MSTNPKDDNDFKHDQDVKNEKAKSNLSEKFESLKKKENLDTMMDYAKTHVPDTIAYILLVIGIIWLFFNSFYGGILVGLVAGFYFTNDIVRLFSSFDEYLGEYGVAKNIVFAGTALALFILAPGVFIGGAIMVGIKYLLKYSES